MSESLRTHVEAVLNTSDPDSTVALAAFEALRAALESGEVRAASRRADGSWAAHAWVKQGLLLGFRYGQMRDLSAAPFSFFDKHTVPPRSLNLDDGVRIVPGGTVIRSGAYVSAGVICMPPAYVNIGAYVDEGTMVDSHALVGSCAQIGKRVHLSAAVQIGGVLEPPGALPVIVEDDAFIGGGCGVYEGCLIRERAVLAPGVILTGSSRVYDLVQERVITRAGDSPLEIPADAVVVPGSRPSPSTFAKTQGIALYAPIIVKYRDAGTDAATALEAALR